MIKLANLSRSLKNMQRYFDIGFNATDPVFRGIYREKKVHPNDFNEILLRAKEVGCCEMMITGGCLKDSKEAFELAQEYCNFTSTVGCHPTRVTEFEKYPEGPEEYLKEIYKLALFGKKVGKVVSFGEIGLDYDRLGYASKELQTKYFEKQLSIAPKLDLPLFLHSRAAADDFIAILSPYLPQLPRKGCVHSFTGTLEEMQHYISLGLSIGVNGCSLKTEENLKVVKEIPLEYLMLETDAPWCSISPTHASYPYIKDTSYVFCAEKKDKFISGKMVRGRNEPCTIIQVACVVSHLKGLSIEKVSEAAYLNSIKMFGNQSI
ncbi:hypothetical protein T552_01074 [Pneumocystis carinii B80]|uniref:TatD family hydrolase n=1 Tax=Pneumocystis carinii (strain B80) TaxID=1408658 RepID=A0A0W4ZNB2_PNEC8|nr:hypothetical protein T552_01074 [Pneumocystis carinii B80]KTW29870.1 hypothetical protein T552_01074 [Pneumocystis carinii B80]